MSTLPVRLQLRSTRPILDMALRRAKPGTGSTLTFLSTRTWSDPMIALDLDSITTPFVIVGGVATALYMPERLTLDLDILILPSDEAAMQAEIKQAGGEYKGTQSADETSWLFPDASKLDVLAPHEPWVKQAVQTPNMAPSGQPVIALP